MPRQLVGKEEIQDSPFMFLFILKMREVLIWEFGNVKSVQYPIKEARRRAFPPALCPAF